MNIEPAQQVPVDDPDRPACRCHDLPDCPEQATVEINAAELAHVAELLDLIDGFLRSGNGIADRLTDYLQTTARDPRTTAPPGAKYNANLVIDLVSFTAHARIRPADGSQMAVQIMTVLRATRQSGVSRLDNEGFWDARNMIRRSPSWAIVRVTSATDRPSRSTAVTTTVSAARA